MPLPSAPAPVRPTPILARCRRPWTGWVQVLAAAMMILSPLPSGMASWSDTNADSHNDTWTDPNTSIATTLADLNTQNVDADNDGATNDEEAAEGSDPFNYDSDYDGISDGDELHIVKPLLGVSLTNWDSDNDEVSDYDEWYNFSGVTYPGGALPNFPGASYSDYDGDGLKNPVDSAPTVPYDPNTTDTDGDYIADAYDPFPSDITNYSSINNIVWNNGALNDDDGDLILNWQDTEPYGPWDSDLDGIPDAYDPFTNDPTNYSSANGIAWYGDALGDADGDNTVNWEDTNPYNTPVDSDSDGFYDNTDPYPNDSTNYSSINNVTWNGDVLGDADSDGTPNWQDTDPWPPVDTDGDGILDGSDPFPSDATNYSSLNDTNWYGDVLADADSDQVLNWADPYPNDSTNYSSTNGVAWGADVLGDADGDAIQNWQDGLPYGDTPPDPDNDGDGLTLSVENTYGTSDSDVDCDNDGLSDYEELIIYSTNPLNVHSISQGRGWGDLYTDYQLVDGTDTDTDGIPDRIETFYGMLPNDPADSAGDLDGNGMSNQVQYNAGLALNVDLNHYDVDGDSMSDIFEDYYGLDKNSIADAVADTDNDGVLNFEESKLLLSPLAADTDAVGGLGDLGVLMEAMLYPGGTAPTADTDADGIADWMETALVGTNPRFTRVTVGDLDGDGMPDLWEHQYGRWKYPTLGLSVRHHDAAADADHDLLTNLQEHQFQSHPLINDTDGNGTLDGYEDADGDGVHLVGELLLGTDPFNPDSDGDGISDGDEDSDGDGISNPAEINLGTDPLAKDSDGDGWDDDEELALGGDPNDPDDQPVLEPSSSYVTIQTRWVGANWHEQGGDYYSMHWNYIWTSTDPPVGDWQFSESHSSNPREEQGEAQFSDGETLPVSSLGEAQGALSNLSQVSEWEDLGGGNMIVGSSFGEVPGRPQPDPPQWFPEYPNGTSSHGWEGSTQDTRAWNGGAMEVRLTWKPNAPKPHRRQDVTFNLVKTKTITGQDPTYTVYPLQLLANQEYSTSGGTAGGVIALAANATTPDTSVAESLGQVGQVLQPKLAENTTPTGNSALEIEKDSDGKEILEHVTHVRLCRWLGAYYGQDIADRAKFPKDDHDRFVIRLPLPDKAGAGMISVQLSTEDAAGIQTDDPTEIELTETGANSGVFESPALALAADEDDDKLTKDENAKNDPTHLGKAGGKIVVKIPALQNAQMKFDIQAATHKLKVTFVAITPPTAGSFTVKLWSTPPVPVAVSLTPQQCLDEIAKQKKRCIEIYAQLGIQVEATDRGSLSAYGSDAAAWSRIDDAIRKGNVESGPALDAIPLEERGFDLLGRMGDIKQLASSLKEEDNIVVVLIPAAFADIPGNSENEQGAAGLYVNAHEGWCFVSIPWIVQAAYKSATATHEIGHGLGLTHDTRMACELMCSGANPNAHGIANPSNPYRDQKRFVWPDIKKLLKERISNPLAKKFLIPVTP